MERERGHLESQETLGTQVPRISTSGCTINTYVCTCMHYKHVLVCRVYNKPYLGTWTHKGPVSVCTFEYSCTRVCKYMNLYTWVHNKPVFVHK